jgi:hypothetical protein
MDRPMKKALFAVIPLLALAACAEIAEPVACPAWIPPAVQVTAQDSVTGANVTPGATLVLRDGAYADSVTAPPIMTSVGLGPNRAGTFSLTVRQTGYQSWTKTAIKAEEGQCGVQTVPVVARLKPLA